MLKEEENGAKFGPSHHQEIQQVEIHKNDSATVKLEEAVLVAGKVDGRMGWLCQCCSSIACTPCIQPKVKQIKDESQLLQKHGNIISFAYIFR